MTKKEWIENNHSFYHITPTKNLNEILKVGLQNRNGIGICVVRSNNSLIIKYICEMMLIADGDSKFSIIEIIPADHTLIEAEIGEDNVVEVTNDLHNYILRESISIKPKNIIGEYETDPMGITNLKEFEKRISGLIQKLE